MNAPVAALPVSKSAQEERRFSAETDASYSVSFDRSDAYEELEEAYHDALEPGWDGYGADAASHDAYIDTRRFLSMLPMAVPSPHIDVTPQGRFLLFWEPDADKMLSLTIGATGEIAYAVLDETEDRIGSPFFADFIPDDIVAELFRLHS